MDNVAIESFIQHCDEMMIAEEGVGMRIKNGVTKVLGAILNFLDRVLSKIKTLSTKDLLVQEKIYNAYMKAISKSEDCARSAEEEMHKIFKLLKEARLDDEMFTYDEQMEDTEKICNALKRPKGLLIEANDALNEVDNQIDMPGNNDGSCISIKVSDLYKKIYMYKVKCQKYQREINRNIEYLFNEDIFSATSEFWDVICKILRLYEKMANTTTKLLSKQTKK